MKYNWSLLLVASSSSKFKLHPWKSDRDWHLPSGFIHLTKATWAAAVMLWAQSDSCTSHQRFTQPFLFWSSGRLVWSKKEKKIVIWTASCKSKIFSHVPKKGTTPTYCIILGQEDTVMVATFHDWSGKIPAFILLLVSKLQLSWQLFRTLQQSSGKITP